MVPIPICFLAIHMINVARFFIYTEILAFQFFERDEIYSNSIKGVFVKIQNNSFLKISCIALHIAFIYKMIEF